MLGVHMILGDVYETRSQVQDRDIDPSLVYWFLEIWALKCQEQFQVDAIRLY